MRDKNLLLDRFEKYLKLKGIRSYKDYIRQIEEFFIYLDSRDIDFYTFNINQGERYINHLLDKKICLSTINNKLNKVKAFYSFLDKKEFILSNRILELKGLKQSKTIPKNILETEDMGKLLNNLTCSKEKDYMLVAIIELLYGSAIRISEVVGLKCDDINYREGTIVITEEKKGGTRRVVPATDKSLNSVYNYLKISNRFDKEYVFPRQSKTTIRAFVNRRLKLECAKHGFNDLTTHSFRHSAATSMLRSGAGIREVQAFLGHESILSTEKYTRVIKEDLKRVVRECHPREAL